MTWGYRVIEFRSGTDEARQAIHEVYYDESGVPMGYTANPAAVIGVEGDCEDGNMTDSLIWTLDQMREAVQRPVLRESDFMGSMPEEETVE